jgi:hypothetical protein
MIVPARVDDGIIVPISLMDWIRTMSYIVRSTPMKTNPETHRKPKGSILYPAKGQSYTQSRFFPDSLKEIIGAKKRNEVIAL